MRISRSDLKWRVFEGGHVIHENLEALAYHSGYRVGEVGSALGVSEQHLRRIFHRDVGIPIKDWMKLERMVIARRMLVCGFDCDTISDSLGFAHPNSFRREFKEVYEMPFTHFLKLRHARHRLYEERDPQARHH